MRSFHVLGTLLGVTLALWHFSAAEPGARPARVDRFGVAQLFPTRKGGREWFARWEGERAVPPYTIDPLDPLFRNEAGTLRIKDGTASLEPEQSRLNIRTPRDAQGRYTAPQWQNVEMTVYVKRGPTSRTLDYQAFDLSARSGERHNDEQPCEGTSYHATVRFDGLCGFKKEIWHTGGYTKLAPVPAPKPWPTVPEGRWIGIKFICRNADHDQHVSLQLYLDPEERGTWKRVVEYTDAGGWQGEKEGCGRPTDMILRDPRPAVYFRTDYVTADVKQLSVREIEPLP